MHTKLNHTFGALQWLVFLLANAVALPIVIGQIFHLPADQTADLMQRTFFIVGISSFLQAWLGHRLPILDGPAGTWLGVFVILGDSVIRTGGDAGGILRILESGMLLTGVLLLILGATGVIRKLIPLFTPLVTGTYLLLLALQLSGTFLQGMAGVSGNPPQANWGVAIVSLSVFILVLLLSIRGKGWIQSYAVLIGILTGCALFYIFFEGDGITAVDSFFRLPEFLAWGAPDWDLGIAASVPIIALILLSNTIASIAAMKQTERPDAAPNAKELNRGAVVSGFSHMLATGFSTVATVPISGSAGFVRLTGQRSKLPFLVACTLLIIVTLFPGLIRYLTLLPGPVAYAALLASFVQMVGIGMQAIVRSTLDQRRMTILGIGLMLGVGSMFLPASVFQTLPSFMRYVFGNGLLFGTLIVIVLEQVWRPERLADKQPA